MTIPAPMPVPTVISIASSCPRAAPSLTSAHAAALASFSTTTGSPTLDSTFSRSGSSRQARFGAKRMLDRSASTKPAAPMPTASAACRLSSSVTASLIASAVRAGLAEGVDLSSFSTILPCWSTAPAATLVPPTSTPIVRLMRSFLLAAASLRWLRGWRYRTRPGRRLAHGEDRLEGREGLVDSSGDGVAGGTGLPAQAEPGPADPAGRPAHRAPRALGSLVHGVRRLGGGRGPYVLAVPPAAEGAAHLVAYLAPDAARGRLQQPALESLHQVVDRWRAAPACRPTLVAVAAPGRCAPRRRPPR